MRESVLNALIHLFAIVAAVNSKGITESGLSVLRSYLSRYLPPHLIKKYLSLFNDYVAFYQDELVQSENKEDSENPLLSFQVSNVCHQIRNDLIRKERIIVFVQLFEFVNEDNIISPEENDFMHYVSDAFHIDSSVFSDIEHFVLHTTQKIDPSHLLVVGTEDSSYKANSRFFLSEKQDKDEKLEVLEIPGIDAFILRFTGKSEIYINTNTIIPDELYLFNIGDIIKLSDTYSLYYSDIYADFHPEVMQKVQFAADTISYHYRGTDQGVQPFSFSIDGGQLVGIMGGSGTGKSTLLKMLSGKLKPHAGNVYFNGLDLYENKIKLKGLIGYVPQDDLLIEELSVYQNLYYNCRLSFGSYSPAQAHKLVNKVLTDLDLAEIKDLRVGDILNNVISGGQRKRLNIGLELLREPTLLFVDEPTSGLSSTDSENIIQLLKQQSAQGKVVITTIHQPSSKIYRLYDKIWILDKSGYPVYAGNPVEAIEYFKKISAQVDAVEGGCPVCGSLNPEHILEVIEDKKVDDAGSKIALRKIQTEKWYNYYRSNIEKNVDLEIQKIPLPSTGFKLPSDQLQFIIFFSRNFLRKLQNRQYWFINLLEAPILAVILAFFSKYISGNEYIFSENKNIPVFLFMAIIVALFMGLTVSAEEIFRDRKILERESYLFLSRPIYLNSKMLFLFALSAIQTLSFVVISTAILEIHHMTLVYWLVLFSTSCFGNILGLNISAALDSVIAIYILIPLILVPEILLGGAMIPYDDLNKNISNQKNVPFIGDIMVTRWAYEALAVEQFKNNEYEKLIFQPEKKASNANYITNFLIPEMRTRLALLRQDLGIAEKEPNITASLYLISDVLFRLEKYHNLAPFEYYDSLRTRFINQGILDELEGYIYYLQETLNDESLAALGRKDQILDSLNSTLGKEETFALKQKNHNEKLTTLVLNRNQIRKILIWKDRWVQKKDPIFMVPENKFGRAQMFSASKLVNETLIDTFLFNLIVIWITILAFYFLLIFNVLRKIITLLHLQ